MCQLCVNHPVSIYSKIHSLKEKTFTSANNVTVDAMERGKAMFGKATYQLEKASPVYFHMQKKAKGFGSGQNVLHTVSVKNKDEKYS